MLAVARLRKHTLDDDKTEIPGNGVTHHRRIGAREVELVVSYEVFDDLTQVNTHLRTHLETYAQVDQEQCVTYDCFLAVFQRVRFVYMVDSYYPVVVGTLGLLVYY